ncbi:hypothetical protein FNO01nite_17330 [Flavobacterium noncentrifugens]|nr:hypothetical protein FNO01nite_17330 [Flavobacterium noncentrifugens]
MDSKNKRRRKTNDSEQFHIDESVLFVTKIVGLNIKIMETNWLILSIAGIAVLGLMVYLIRENRKDEKTFEKDLDHAPEYNEEDSELNNED